MAIAGLTGLAKSVCYALVLGPNDFGTVAIIQVISAIAIFVVSAGLMEGLSLKLPSLYARSETSQAYDTTQTALRAYLLIAVAALVVLSPLGFLIGQGQVTYLGLLTMATAGTFSILLTDMRSRGELLAFGLYSLARTIGALVLGLAGAYLWGLQGAIIGEVLGLAFLSSLVWSRIPRAQGSTSGLVATSRELRTLGRPMLAFQLSQLLHTSLDRWVVALALGTAALGQYSLAALSTVVAALVHATLYQQLGPEALRSNAMQGEWRTAFLRIQRFSLVAAAIMLVGGFACWGISFFLRDNLLAEYNKALDILPWLIGAAALQVAQLFDWILAAAGKMRLLILAGYLTALGQVALGLLCFIFAMDIHYYAAITFLSRAIILAASYSIARKIAIG